MKFSGLLLFAWLAVTMSASAQITVDLVTERDQFVPGEAIPMTIRLVNNSGQTLHFGQEDWLSFNVEKRGGSIVPANGSPPVAHDLDLKASQRLSQQVNLAPGYDLSKPGRYTVVANISVKAWGAELTSQIKNFDIIKGSKLWEQSFGVPQTQGANSALPEVRKFMLEQATFVNSMRLYLRLTDDAEGRTIRVLNLGPMISFSNPQERFDKVSNLHVLYQVGARLYNYTTVSPDGEILARQTYIYGEVPPRLSEAKDGRIMVAGVRRISMDDLPKPTPPEEPKAPAPAPTPTPTEQ